MSQMGRSFTTSGAGGFVQTITGNDGIPAVPTAGNINIVGGNNITITNTGVSTETVSVTGTTNHSLLIGNASGSISSLGVATNGQLPIGSTGVDPVLATLTAGAGISIANAAGSITISVSGGGFTWTEVLGVAQGMAVENGYVANNVALVTLTLPAVAAFGDEVRIVGKGTGLWRIAQNAGQTIHFGISDTTPGAGGSLTANNRYDCVELLCTTANTDWTVMSVQGNLTVV